VLEFDELTHTYRYYGRIVPSVTQVLDRENGLEFVDAELLAIAAEFGTHVHQACHLYNIGELDPASLDDGIGAYLAGWIKFLTDTDFVVTASERRVFHEVKQYAGTLDATGILPKLKEPILLDIKTGSSLPKTVGPQTAAYAQALGRRMARYCVLLGPESYKLVSLRELRDYDVFNAALTLHRWRTTT
jgi:hypothetical protein